MNIFKTIADAIGLVSRLKKEKTPEHGENIAKAGKNLIKAGLGLNVVSIGGISSMTLEDFIHYFDTAPVPTSIMITVFLILNIAPHVAGLVYSQVGKSQV